MLCASFNTFFSQTCSMLHDADFLMRYLLHPIQKENWFHFQIWSYYLSFHGFNSHFLSTRVVGVQSRTSVCLLLLGLSIFHVSISISATRDNILQNISAFTFFFKELLLYVTIAMMLQHNSSIFRTALFF